MKNYLTTLNDREKWMVISGTLALLFYCYYLFLYAPLSHSVKRKSTQLIEKNQTLQWMQSIQGQAKMTKPKQTVNDNQLLTLLANQLKEHKTLRFPFQLQQTGIGDIQLSFENVPFNLFITWLSTLNESYTIEVKQLNVEQTKTPGVVRLMITLSGI